MHRRFPAAHPRPLGRITYHALVDCLAPDSLHLYTVTADNDSNAAQPFSGSFHTAPCGTITINDHHAPGADKTPTADYELFETVVLAKHGRGRR